MSKDTTLWLVRHGHIVLPPQKSFIGQTDLPLSELGRQQIKLWRHFFANQHIAVILASDLQRCKESASILCPANTPIVYDSAFREICLGTWEGRAVADIRTHEAVHYATRGAQIDTFRPTQGESFNDLAIRVHTALQHYSQLYAGKNILLVAHAGVNRVILAHHMSLHLKDVLRIPQPYACCARLPMQCIQQN